MLFLHRTSCLDPLVTSKDDNEKEYTSIPRVWMELKDPKGIAMFPAKLPILQHTNSATYSLHDPSPKQLNDPILLDILISQCRIHWALLSHTHLQSAFIIGAIVRRQQELLVLHHYPALLLPMTWVKECLDHLL